MKASWHLKGNVFTLKTCLKPSEIFPCLHLSSHLKGQVQKVSASIFLAVAWATSVGSSLALHCKYKTIQDNLIKKKNSVVTRLQGVHVLFYVLHLRFGFWTGFGLRPHDTEYSLDVTQDDSRWQVRCDILCDDRCWSLHAPEPKPFWTMDHYGPMDMLYKSFTASYMLLALLAHPKHFKRSVITLEPVPTARNPFVDLIEYSLPKYNSNQV